MADTKPTPEQIDDARNDAQDIVDTVGTKWRSMTYEQGVANALGWVAGDSEHPLEEN